MKFFADHCVTESVCRVLEARGHEVVRLRDVLPTDSPDPLVARYAEQIDAILISHDGDFKKIAPRVPSGARRRFKKLSRIHLACDYPQSDKRIAAALTLIEFEWGIAQQRTDNRLRMVINKSNIRTER